MAKMTLNLDSKKIKQTEKAMSKLTKAEKSQLTSMEAGVSRDNRKKATKAKKK